MSSPAKTPHPAIPDRRRAMFGSDCPVFLPMLLRIVALVRYRLVP